MLSTTWLEAVFVDVGCVASGTQRPTKHYDTFFAQQNIAFYFGALPTYSLPLDPLNI
jgi:hypothetical protein